ncbi:MAG TPA: SBBP repeat-containing protein, partial [Niastella sp.]|nr:SBBP repeat-containing protein [Niastella sp.]
MQNTITFKKLLLLAPILFSSAFCLAQVTQKWVNRQNGDPNSTDWANALAVDHHGYIYVTGYSLGKGTNNDFATVKYDEGSNTQWVKKYNGPGNDEDEAVAICTDHNGNVYVTGYSTGNGTGRDLTTIKYDAGSNTKWVKRFNGTGNGNDAAVAVAVDDDGNVYITGSTNNTGTSFDYTTIKYNKDGDTKWVRTYNGPGNGNDLPTALAVDNDGNVYVTGQSTGTGTDLDYATIKYNTSGVQQWVKRYNGSINNWDRPNAMVIDKNGNVYITGFTTTVLSEEDGILTDIATIKYNTTGTQQWVAFYNRKGHDEANALAVDAAGNVYITGFSGSAEEDPDNDYVTIKYNSNGLQQWASIYEGAGFDQGGGANALVLDAAGNVYITGAISIEEE